MTELDEWVRRTAEVQPPPRVMAGLDQRMAHVDELAGNCQVTVDPTTAVFILYAAIHLAVASGVPGPGQSGHQAALMDTVGCLAYGFAHRHLDAL